MSQFIWPSMCVKFGILVSISACSFEYEITEIEFNGNVLKLYWSNLWAQFLKIHAFTCTYEHARTHALFAPNDATSFVYCQREFHILYIGYSFRLQTISTKYSSIFSLLFLIGKNHKTEILRRSLWPNLICIQKCMCVLCVHWKMCTGGNEEKNTKTSTSTRAVARFHFCFHFCCKCVRVKIHVCGFGIWVSVGAYLNASLVTSSFTKIHYIHTSCVL